MGYEFRVNFLNNENFPLIDTSHNCTTLQITTLQITKKPSIQKAFYIFRGEIHRQSDHR